MNFKLERPLAVFDTESTGTSIGKDRIIEISVTKHHPDGSSETRACYIDPCMDIPKEASDVHGITTEKMQQLIADKKAFKFVSIAKNLSEFITGCDFAGFMIINFDIPLLSEEFSRCGIKFPEPDALFLDAGNIFKKMEPRTLVAGLKFYCDEELPEAHQAGADVTASFKVLNAQIERYPELKGKTIQEIAEFCKMDNRVDLAGSFVRKDDGKVYFAFGKHKDSKVADVFKSDHSYYNWIMDKSDMTADTKAHAKYFYEAVNPPKK